MNFFRQMLSFLLLYLAIIGISPSHALLSQCSDSPVTFDYRASEGLKCLCDTAKAAIAFLKPLGLETGGAITIRIVNQFPLPQENNVVGYYHADSREIYVLSYTTFKDRSRADGSASGEESSEETWCSYVTHELAHAISSEKILPETSNHLAGEYIAAVTQLSVLSPQSRENVLDKYRDIKPYTSISEMSSLYFLLAPKAFAVKCYRHFIALDNPGYFIEQLVNADNEFQDQY